MSEWDFAFGLSGQELQDALATGATADEWAHMEAREAEDDKARNTRTVRHLDPRASR